MLLIPYMRIYDYIFTSWQEKNKEEEWVKKAETEPSIIINYVETLPQKTLKKAKQTNTSNIGTRFSNRLAQNRKKND